MFSFEASLGLHLMFSDVFYFSFDDAKVRRFSQKWAKYMLNSIENAVFIDIRQESCPLFPFLMYVGKQSKNRTIKKDVPETIQVHPTMVED